MASTDGGDIKIDCIPVALSNHGETVPVFTTDEEYSNTSAQADFMKTIVIFGIVLFIVIVVYLSVPLLYKSIIVDNVTKYITTSMADRINFIGGIDIFIAITIVIIAFYNFIVGASSIGDNQSTQDENGNRVGGNVKAEVDGYNKIIFGFVSGFFFMFSGFLIFTRKKTFLHIVDTEEIKIYAKSLSMDNFKKVLVSYLGILWNIYDLPFSIILSALVVYYIILVILITARGTKQPEWVEVNGVSKFKGNDIITEQTFYDCCFFYPFVLVFPVFAGIGYIVKQMQLAKYSG